MIASIRKSIWLLTSLFSLYAVANTDNFTAHTAPNVSLEKALAMAQQNDPWLHRNQLQQHAMLKRSEAANTLPDPQVSIGMQNLPTDSWSFDQDGMTQLKVGVSQMFPRGNSLAIKAKQFAGTAEQLGWQRDDRLLQIKRDVTELWLDAYLAQQTITLIDNDRALFEQMVEVAKSSYASALGKTRQQDVIRAQLEIVQLDDRLVQQQQAYETAIAKLAQWLHVFDASSADAMFDGSHWLADFSLPDELPNINLIDESIIAQNRSATYIVEQLSFHPAILAVDSKQRVSQQEIHVAKQQYKPQWGINASYAYRDDMPNGMSRSDLFSIGVTFDVPLFTENRQDSIVAASIADVESVKTEKLLLLKQMLSEVVKETRQLKRLNERHELYQAKLGVQSQQQAEAALTAYTNDDGDFAEVVRARIAELNVRIASLQIEVSRLKTISRLNYLLTPVQ